MKKIDLSKEYSKILAKYMRTFKLESIDIAFLIKSKKEVVDGLLNQKNGVVLNTLERIASLFGLRYYEFGNPKHPLVSYKQLPEITKNRIAYRLKEGPAKDTNYQSSDINSQINEVLNQYKIGDEFLAEDIERSIYEKYGTHYSITEIVNRFNKSFKEHIENTKRKDTSKTGRGPKPNFYKLIKRK